MSNKTTEKRISRRKIMPSVREYLKANGATDTEIDAYNRECDDETNKENV